MFSKTKPEAKLYEEGDHVFILTPLSEPIKVQFLTDIPLTYSCSWPLPKLPILMPWPGPQATPFTSIDWLPDTMDTQSSPVPMTDLDILMFLEVPMWMPSVLGLSAGAESLTWLMLMFSQAKMLKWELLLLMDSMFSTLEFLTKSNLNVCIQTLNPKL